MDHGCQAVGPGSPRYELAGGGFTRWTTDGAVARAPVSCVVRAAVQADSELLPSKKHKIFLGPPAETMTAAEAWNRCVCWVASFATMHASPPGCGDGSVGIHITAVLRIGDRGDKPPFVCFISEFELKRKETIQPRFHRSGGNGLRPRVPQHHAARHGAQPPCKSAHRHKWTPSRVTPRTLHTRTVRYLLQYVRDTNRERCTIPPVHACTSIVSNNWQPSSILQWSTIQ